MINHNIVNNTLQMSFPEYTLPDDLKVEMEFNNYKLDKLNLQKLVYRKYPKTDRIINYKLTAVELLSLKNQPVHNQLCIKIVNCLGECLDAACTNHSNMIKRPRLKKLNLNEWQPMEYPLLQFNQENIKLIPSIMENINKELCMNAIRSICKYTSNNQPFQLPNHYDFIEAILFETVQGTVPEKFSIICSGNKIDIYPTSTYNFLGMIPISNIRYTKIEIVCETDFSLIGHHFYGDTDVPIDGIDKIFTRYTVYDNEKKNRQCISNYANSMYGCFLK